MPPWGPVGLGSGHQPWGWPQFSFPSCKFKVQKSKLGTGRVVMWRLGVSNSYTMEAAFGGSTLGEGPGVLVSVCRCRVGHGTRSCCLFGAPCVPSRREALTLHRAGPHGAGLPPLRHPPRLLRPGPGQGGFSRGTRGAPGASGDADCVPQFQQCLSEVDALLRQRLGRDPGAGGSWSDVSPSELESRYIPAVPRWCWCQ